MNHISEVIRLRAELKKLQEDTWTKVEDHLKKAYREVAPYKKGEIVELDIEWDGKHYFKSIVTDGWVYSGDPITGMCVKGLCLTDDGEKTDIEITLTIDNDEKVKAAFEKLMSNAT